MRNRIARIVPVVLAGAVLAAGCTGGKQTPAQQEGSRRDTTVAGLIARQPAHTGAYSPTRDDINFWIDTWLHQPGKLAYVYLQAANGQLVGYYIFKGLPVSYCTALTPNYSFVDIPNDGSDAKAQVPAPGVDGVYYSGGDCARYYGKDASTGAYMEFTAGGGSQDMQIYDRPLPRQNVQPLGFAKIEDFR